MRCSNQQDVWLVPPDKLTQSMGISACLIVGKRRIFDNDAPVGPVLDQFVGAIPNVASQRRCHYLFAQFISEVSGTAKKLESRPVKPVVVLFRENPDTTMVSEIRRFPCRNVTCECFELARFQTRAAQGASVFDPSRFFVDALKRFIRA
jgi:hypothetical protein